MAKLTTEEFIARARAVHGDRYDYSRVEYTARASKVTIICPEHGPFEQRAGEHAPRGKGCLHCGNKYRARGSSGSSGLPRLSRRLNSEQFITKAREVHGDRYDYSAVEYKTMKERVTIICPDHGPFEQRAGNHLTLKRGCAKCTQTTRRLRKPRKPRKPAKRKPARKGPPLRRNRLTTEMFITKAREVHGDRYDYSRVEYLNNETKVTIICPDHGPFEQRPWSHTATKHGCPSCAVSGYRSNDRGTLYYYRIQAPGHDQPFYKVGITNHKDPDKRAKTWGVADGVAYELIALRRGGGAGIAAREKEIIERYKDAIAADTAVEFMRNGWSEVFSRDVLGLDLAA